MKIPSSSGCPSSAPDAAFPYWSSDQAQRLPGAGAAAFADAGVEATVHADYAEDASRRKFSLGNLAAVCHNDNRGERAWRKIVQNHIQTIPSGMAAQSPWPRCSTSIFRRQSRISPTSMSAASVITRCVKPGSAASAPSRSPNMRRLSTTAARSWSCSGVGLAAAGIRAHAGPVRAVGRSRPWSIRRRA